MRRKRCYSFLIMWSAIGSIRTALSASLLGLALLPWGCHKKPRAPLPPTPLPPIASSLAPVPVPAPIPSSIPKLPASPSYLDVGENYFEMGDYAKAAQAYETYLQNNYSPANQDQALFRLALTHALPASPVRDLPKATSLLQQLTKHFPESPWRPQAELLLGLQGEINKLRTDVSKRDEHIRDLSRELERLKQIDMRRRPTAP